MYGYHLNHFIYGRIILCITGDISNHIVTYLCLLNNNSCSIYVSTENYFKMVALRHWVHLVNCMCSKYFITQWKDLEFFRFIRPGPHRAFMTFLWLKLISQPTMPFVSNFALTRRGIYVQISIEHQRIVLCFEIHKHISSRFLEVNIKFEQMPKITIMGAKFSFRIVSLIKGRFRSKLS